MLLHRGGYGQRDGSVYWNSEFERETMRAELEETIWISVRRVDCCAVSDALDKLGLTAW